MTDNNFTTAKTKPKSQYSKHKISKLDIPKSARDFFASKGFENLYPPQAAAVHAGLLKGTSLLVSAPTASGKTLVAMLAIISHIACGGRRVVYLSPLRALAAEKYVEFAELSRISTDGAGWEKMRSVDGSMGDDTKKRTIKTIRATGDTRSGNRGISASGGRVSDAHIIVATNEAMDSAIRRNLAWTEDIDLVITDEVHLIGDQTRGPTLEMVLTQLKKKRHMPSDTDHNNDGDESDDTIPDVNNSIQIVGLSATVQNDVEIARWLGCMLVRSDWRPVPLTEGVCDLLGSVQMNDGRKFKVNAGPEGLAARLGVDAVMEGGQSLIFAATRPSSRATAVRTSKLVASTLTEQEKNALAKVAAKLLPSAGSKKPRNPKGKKNDVKGKDDDGDDLISPSITDLQKDAATMITRGVAFHHAGLSDRMRTIIEDEFRKGRIKLLASTPTLAAGVNLPARRVVISTVNRYDPKYGYNRPISVLEYKQLCGRAGRPQYDTYGESIVCTSDNAFSTFHNFIEGDIEPLESQIMEPKALHTHLLTVIVLNPGIKRDDITSFFVQTLAGVQFYKDDIINAVDTELDFLLGINMITTKGVRYAATRLGKRTSSLYVDPATAAYLYGVADAAPRGNPQKPTRHTLGFLHAVTNCDEFLPKQALLKKHHQLAHDLLYGPHRSELLTPVFADDCTRGLFVLHAWISERTDKEIETAFKSQSGDLHRMTETAAWLVYVLREMAKHAGRDDLLDELAILRARIRFGIKEELVDLTSARGIGRVRARALYNAGIRNLATLNTTSLSKLSTIRQIGPTVAASIKREATIRAKRV